MAEQKHVIPAIIADSAADFADVTAVRWLVKKEMQDRSYRELDSARKRVWHALAKRGFANTHIALIGTTAYEWIASYVGLVSGNCVAVPLDAGLPVEELEDLLNRSDSEALFLSPKMKGIIPDVKAACPKIRLVILLDEKTSDKAEEDIITFGDLILEAEAADISAEDSPEEDDVCTFIYTSGTTGKSKGVMLTQRNLYDNMKNIVITADPGMKMLSVLPIHHAYCLVMDWLMGFSKGATLCINDSLLHCATSASLNRISC